MYQNFKGFLKFTYVHYCNQGNSSNMFNILKLI